MRTIAHPLSVLVLGTAAAAGVGGYALLYLGVAASWVGVPIVGAGVLAAAGVLASEGALQWGSTPAARYGGRRGRAASCR
ncbi:MAG: hypothetical protein ABI323_15135 [Solirubrobacteraceae bacterium]